MLSSVAVYKIVLKNVIIWLCWDLECYIPTLSIFALSVLICLEYVSSLDMDSEVWIWIANDRLTIDVYKFNLNT